MPEVRGMAYLIELCGNMPAIPLDEDECCYGISLVLIDIHDEILNFVRVIEQLEIQKERAKDRKERKHKTPPRQ